MKKEDGLGFENIIKWKAWHKDGSVFAEGEKHNQVQTLVKESVIDALDTGSMNAIIEMAIGTASGASASSTHLWSQSSYEDITGGQTQPTSTSLQNVGSFTNVSGTITEAGLFSVTGCASGMYFYDDGLNVTLSASDTLQITWTVNCTGT